jgi:hypothetical protein
VVSTGSRSGSSMSSRQMARAATDGRRISFQWVASNGNYVAPLDGYLVGMDDFHWLVLTTPNQQIALIHKTSPDITLIKKSCSLTSESEATQLAVEEMGRAFFNFCDRTYLGKSETTQPCT